MGSRSVLKRQKRGRMVRAVMASALNPAAENESRPQPDLTLMRTDDGWSEHDHVSVVAV